MKKYLRLYLNLSLFVSSTCVLIGCSKPGDIAELPCTLISLPIAIVGLPLAYGILAVQGEFDYHKHYANQNQMVGKKYELVQDAFLYHNQEEKRLRLDKGREEEGMDIVPCGTWLTVTHVTVERANIESGLYYHRVLAVFYLEGNEVQANISALFDCKYLSLDENKNFIPIPSSMFEIKNLHE